MVFELARLPPEVRQLVWEATLPGPRIFHVSELAAPPTSDNSDKDDKDDRPTTLLDFHIRHPPPASHGICRESRAITLLRGFFFSSSAAGPWFNPRRDMLYLDRNMRHRLNTTRTPVPGLDRVLHVGLEWRAWFRDVPRPPSSSGISSHDGEGASGRRWRAAMAPLLLRHCRGRGRRTGAGCRRAGDGASADRWRERAGGVARHTEADAGGGRGSAAGGRRER
ncbi:hypothetical protein ISF_05586 [Cordyceps fumosorosea ARSEF 2679]|uniref:2EXR domain-containing protein n=1 Tax=Cordyceps fumosorosea (strain ARSEF 2679) TaxID=1081104 RepID=A0A167UEK9_CORFA|nr:hypothetical protein ISF_05586 [Cordyceps fumosorosea ARSEF 2679]OAA61507.1 hypothetical protein ISF_05586 [Cordyceps fumosorosea ARSEF 2679]